MRKILLGITAALILTLALAACAPTGGTEAAPGSVTGNEPPAATEPGADVTQPTAGGAAVGTCEGVDTAQLMSTGETIYTDQCASCHGEQGEGAGNFPGLAANASVTGEDVLGLIQAYFAVDAHPKNLSQEDLGAVLTYTRGAFGNTAAAVCPADVQVPVQ